jgi:hypothetical protein
MERWPTGDDDENSCEGKDELDLSPGGICV